VNLVLGRRGSGKSAFGYKVLEDAHNHGKLCYVMGLPREKQDLLPDWIRLVEDPRELRDDSAIFIDEAYALIFARESMKKFNRMMVKLIGMTRQRSQLLLFATHLTRKLDVGIAYDSNSIIFRQPSHLHRRFERRELRPMLKESSKFFNKLDDDPIRWAYIITEGGTTSVEVDLPSFWSEELSRAFADIELLEEGKEEKEGLKERHREVLENILELEESGDYDLGWGWEWNEVPGMNGGLISKFLSEGLIRRGFTTRSTKCFYGNIEEIKKVLGKT